MRIVFTASLSKFKQPFRKIIESELPEWFRHYHQENSRETARIHEYSRLLAEHVRAHLPEIRALLDYPDIIAVFIRPYWYADSAKTELYWLRYDASRGTSKGRTFETPRRKRPVSRELKSVIAEAYNLAVRAYGPK